MKSSNPNSREVHTMSVLTEMASTKVKMEKLPPMSVVTMRTSDVKMGEVYAMSDFTEMIDNSGAGLILVKDFNYTYYNGELFISSEESDHTLLNYYEDKLNNCTTDLNEHI